MKSTAKRVIKFFLSRYLSIKTKSIIKERCDVNFNTVLEGRNVIHNNVSFSNSKLGYGTYIGKDSKLTNSLIGRYCSIAENVKLITGGHPTNTFVSTHPAFFSTLKQSGFSYVTDTKFNEFKYSDINDMYAVTIGNDVWIGADVKIIGGVNIGDGAIIATGAVVANDLEPYNIYGGVPARRIGTRFTEEEKAFLLSFKWWERETEWISENAFLFSDIKKFMALHSLEYGDGHT
ncbi:hypothetical protein ABE28_015985 [Peribacillus muralis]|uniref:Acetyltransferase n=1 Tax=Peribacillus muralis TaxID=264697 RepID=A0A1B3XRS2_9BACI|nr:CatB-related O-acetyltransferase [Peribacillus muralis]AOH55862.1 hypothetical protein ABE28_015985 [Peribacillus muralis]